jgi:hypothetical protein
MKYEITKEQLRSLTDPKVKEMFPEAFVEPSFQYLEFVNVSFSSDFSQSFNVLYGCKSPDGSHICFSTEKFEIRRIEFIKKLL